MLWGCNVTGFFYNETMAYKNFIDGKEGTTGLKVFERFEKRSDIEIITIDKYRNIKTYCSARLLCFREKPSRRCSLCVLR